MFTIIDYSFSLSIEKHFFLLGPRRNVGPFFLEANFFPQPIQCVANYHHWWFYTQFVCKCIIWFIMFYVSCETRRKLWRCFPSSRTSITTNAMQKTSSPIVINSSIKTFLYIRYPPGMEPNFPLGKNYELPVWCKQIYIFVPDTFKMPSVSNALVNNSF